MFLRAYPHGSTSIAALAGDEIWANRQVCPTIVGVCAEVRAICAGKGLPAASVTGTATNIERKHPDSLLVTWK
jgi:hypothetical protein